MISAFQNKSDITWKSSDGAGLWHPSANQLLFCGFQFDDKHCDLTHRDLRGARNVNVTGARPCPLSLFLLQDWNNSPLLQTYCGKASSRFRRRWREFAGLTSTFTTGNPLAWIANVRASFVSCYISSFFFHAADLHHNTDALSIICSLRWGRFTPRLFTCAPVVPVWCPVDGSRIWSRMSQRDTLVHLFAGGWVTFFSCHTTLTVTGRAS